MQEAGQEIKTIPHRHAPFDLGNSLMEAFLSDDPTPCLGCVKLTIRAN